MSSKDKANLARGAAAIHEAERKARKSGSVVRLDGTIAAVAKKIVRLHGEIMAAAKMSLEKAIEIGGLLARVRASRKGKWLRWLQDNAPFSDQTARNYIRVYECRDDPKFKSVLNLNDAYALLCAPKTDDKPKRETRRSRAVKELVKQGIARDERDAREILEKREEEQAAATVERSNDTSTNVGPFTRATEPAPESEIRADKPQPKGWQPDVLGWNDLTAEEQGIFSQFCARLKDRDEGRFRALERFAREGEWSCGP
jgi:hypothetical protein